MNAKHKTNSSTKSGSSAFPATGKNSRTRSYEQLYKLLIDANQPHEYADRFARSFAEKRSVGCFPPG